MPYKTFTTREDLIGYLSGHSLVSFDFETSPDAQYRRDNRAALDAHKAHIVGMYPSNTTTSI